MSENQNELIWKDRKRPIFGLPLSFTKYQLTTEKILIEKGLFSISQEEVRLYRIMDVTVKCSFLQRIFNVGTIHCCSADKSTPEFDIIDVKNPIKVKDLISQYVENERDRKKISSREFMDFDDDGMHM
ncbi:MAG: PH domain-containing protein [Clostridiales bacterium]|nr:PH domain-containing protein [Clostridiales bacterium]